MESKPFLEIFKRSRPSNSISKRSYFGLTWDQWAKFVKITRRLVYGCNFGNGEKKTCSGRDTHSKKATGICCCGGCVSHVGYLKRIPDNDRAIRRIALLFDREYGFWRKKEGCILSLRYRSDVCIGYRCYAAKKHQSESMGYLAGPTDTFNQMTLCFLDTFRAQSLSDTQARIIIKELIKGVRR